MMPTDLDASTRWAAAGLVVLALAAGCASQPMPPAAASPGGAPTAGEVANITYRGIEEAGGPAALRDGSWEGAPFVEGGTSRPAVGLVPGVLLTGDLDGDGDEEAAVLLYSSSGGSGTRSSIAIVDRRPGGAENVATRLLGDRVQVRSMAIASGTLSIDVVRAGPADPACCPGELATYTWTLGPDGLGDSQPPAVTGRLSTAVLDGTEWTLSHFAYDEEAPGSPTVTLAFSGGQLRGKAGCNGYFTALADLPDAGAGALRLGPVGATQRMCPDEEMAVEDRYLRQLGSVSSFGFMNGRLMLSYPDGVMLFDRAASAQSH
jgi:heat shock protein HslJ